MIAIFCLSVVNKMCQILLEINNNSDKMLLACDGWWDNSIVLGEKRLFFWT